MNKYTIPFLVTLFATMGLSADLSDAFGPTEESIKYQDVNYKQKRDTNKAKVKADKKRRKISEKSRDKAQKKVDKRRAREEQRNVMY